MKRFHSPLSRLLRVRQQLQRMARLQVAQARAAFDTASARTAAAQRQAALQTGALESRLTQPGPPFLVQQSLFELRALESMVHHCREVEAEAAERLKTSVEAYRAAQRAAETVERAVERHRQDHRRDSARAMAVELQEWAMRPDRSPHTGDREEVRHA
ncbi:MAG: hypothetical protein KF861_03590 [Planctomycetaceae bacterium]|nr:hypothetical protein [Planctomycetaceae bacterium]